MGSGAGTGQKPDDWNVVSLCRYHHGEQHRLGEWTFWKHIGERDPWDLRDAFIKASPKRHEIEAIMRERADAA